MNRRWIATTLAVLFFVLGFLILLDQYFLIGIWFQPEDIHHETFAFSAVAMGIGILIGTVLNEAKFNSKN